MDKYEDPLDSYGRGLALINAFCDRWGTMMLQVGEPHYADMSQTWYAEFDYFPDGASPSPTASD
jgi:hypothetical protein